MATLDDILTTQKNGVVAINNISQFMNAANEYTVYLSGTTTSRGVSASGILISTGAGRLARMAVITAGSSQGTIYNFVTVPTTLASGTGTTATLTYTGTLNVTTGSTVVVTNIEPSGYRTAAAGVTLSGTGVQTISYANTTTGNQTTPGRIFHVTPANAIAAIPSSIGVYDLGLNFTSGLYVILGTNQVVSFTYSLD